MAAVANGATVAAPVKDKRRTKVKAKAPIDPPTISLSPPPNDAPEDAVAAAPESIAYVQRLDLTGRCAGETPVTRTPIDLSGVLGEAKALQAMSDDLLRAFRQSPIDLVVAVHEEAAHLHSFTSAIAGAMAGRHGTALGQLSVFRARPKQDATVVAAPTTAPVLRARKRGRPSAAEKKVQSQQSAVSEAATPTVKATAACQRVVSVRHDATGLVVEWRRDLLAAAGTRVLLVSDWIDGVDAVLAARDALLSCGADVVGVSVVVATNARLLEQLSARQIPWSCAWSPTSGAQLTIRPSATSKECQCETTGTSDALPMIRRPKPDEEEMQFQYVTSQYEANLPSEDRSVNAIKPSDPAIRLHAVFDGHGGTVAVEHLKAKLCDEIFARVSSQSSPEEVEAALKQAFIVCDDALKSYLESLSPRLRMSKGYCNTGSCAVVALVVDSTLYVANVGDCAAVLGRRNPITNRVWASELTVEHNCKNASEVKLVMERSRDRNAIRLSKDDQESENAYGVKRVAGSLAVTRAFGDFYLKCEELSSAPFKSKVPYITVEPSISRHQLYHDEEDYAEQILILASDGLWEVVGCEEAVGVVSRYDSQQSAFFANSSAALVHLALEKVAHRDGMMLHELLALPRGRERRRFHDDITCTVVTIKTTSTRPRLASAETVEDNDMVRATDEEQSDSASMVQ